MFVERFVTTFEQVDFGVVQLRIAVFVDGSIFCSEEPQSIRREVDGQWEDGWARFAYSDGARSEENSQWKMKMFRFEGSFNSNG